MVKNGRFVQGFLHTVADYVRVGGAVSAGGGLIVNEKANRKALELCWKIEELSASELQTEISIMASELKNILAEQYDPMTNHQCRKIAQVKNMGPDREWWLGELLEPIPFHPEERWCLHLKTPYKSVVLGVNLGDMTALAVLAHIAHEGPINQNWLDTMEKIYRREAGAEEPGEG